MLYGVKPDYQSLRVFGCLCFPYLRPYNAHKLNFRSSTCTFLGYAFNKKEYKFLDNKGKFYISGHGVFNEKIFSFGNLSIKTTQKVYNPKLYMPDIP